MKTATQRFQPLSTHGDAITVYSDFIESMTRLLAHPETPFLARLIFSQAACLFVKLSNRQAGHNLPKTLWLKPPAVKMMLLRSFAQQLASGRRG